MTPHLITNVALGIGLLATEMTTSPDLWEKYPLLAILAAVLFYQGKKMDTLAKEIKDLAVTIAKTQRPDDEATP